MPSIRLQKLLSAAGIASRRTAEVLIQHGRVTVNGRTIRELGTRADPDRDDVRVDGRRISVDARRRYILLNKPRGYVSTRSDPEGRPTVLDLLERVKEYVYPVGRLDYDSEGLLLLTNDGELAARLTHPRHGIERVYEVRVRGVPDERALARLAAGVTIEGRRTLPAEVREVRQGKGREAAASVLTIVLREGRKRQIRQMCEAVGHPVTRLRRIRIGPIGDPALRAGQFRELTLAELSVLRLAAGLQVARSARRPARTSRGPVRRGSKRPGRPRHG